MQRSEKDPFLVLFKSSASSMPPSPTLEEICHICGDRATIKRYGAPACLGCTVFFRRTVVMNMIYKCLRGNNCIISYPHRCVCRSCRFEKCLQVGLRKNAIHIRDRFGPRKKSSRQTAANNQPSTFLTSWVKLQGEQHNRHLPFFAIHGASVAFRRDNQNVLKYRRRATAQDVNITMKLALEQANEWGDGLEPFKNLGIEVKKSVLSEYFLAFLLIDSTYKTAQEKDQGIWLLPNGSFVHPDYFFGLPQANIDMEEIKTKAQLHYDFVSNILEAVVRSFRKLQIDETECAVLKTILILKPSCSERAVYSGQERVLEGLYTTCMNDLMNYCMMKNIETGVERFGEILLLLSSIRCGVKNIYNHTRVSDLFSDMRFNDSVKNILLY
ncbi:Protein CBG10390 [Caenorhabditis briggsae]|uniref:Protein CBG10390 n=1 Tax=Caenorhabditis briggsae TaxID=6238 RepID=A8XB35_CAEBR|nr:Protein CBG10390 [Caenorhabditis briggsae]CAP29815.2 Protein CBG10390 [Caenorhabditis briggsae]